MADRVADLVEHARSPERDDRILHAALILETLHDEPAAEAEDMFTEARRITRKPR